MYFISDSTAQLFYKFNVLKWKYILNPYFRLIDLTTRHRQETEMETERLRSAQIQAERMLEARERAHRQRVKGLEEQVRSP